MDLKSIVPGPSLTLWRLKTRQAVATSPDVYFLRLEEYRPWDKMRTFSCIGRRDDRKNCAAAKEDLPMPLLSSNRLAVAAMAALAICAMRPLYAEPLEKTKKVGGTTVHYKVVLPNGYDPAKAYPAILAFGGGPQTMNTVDSILSRNFRAEAEKRGYIVIAPAAPDGQLFFEDGARIFPEFLKMILADYKIQDNKFHIAGPSNGGIASFHVAAANPQYFLSVTAFPGIHVGAQRGEASGHFARCACSCTSANSTSTGGTTR